MWSMMTKRCQICVGTLVTTATSRAWFQCVSYPSRLWRRQVSWLESQTLAMSHYMSSNPQTKLTLSQGEGVTWERNNYFALGWPCTLSQWHLQLWFLANLRHRFLASSLSTSCFPTCSMSPLQNNYSNVLANGSTWQSWKNAVRVVVSACSTWFSMVSSVKNTHWPFSRCTASRCTGVYLWWIGNPKMHQAALL